MNENIQGMRHQIIERAKHRCSTGKLALRIWYFINKDD